MKGGAIWIALTCLLVASLVLSSCATKTTTSTTASTTISKTTTTTTTTRTITTTSTTTATTVATGNWWDKLGTPQYGGELVMRYNKNIVNFDPYFSEQSCTIESAWMEKIHADDWTLDPAVYNYFLSFRPSQYVKGYLAESWEVTDPSTYVIHLRKGIHWQDIPPVNGREFTANDVLYHFNRQYGLGDGFTKPSPFHGSSGFTTSLISVTATDKYTVVFKWNVANPEFIMETIQTFGTGQDIEAREAVEKWGDLNDWHHAIGTGPFILNDFVSGSSATLVKNPNYWGYDERYPQNKLPYIDTLKVLIIPDDPTAMAALRTGKIDAMENISLQDAQSIQKSNPEILQIGIPFPAPYTVDLRNDVKPFNDVRVRKAMQMALDLPTIAKTYYGGACPPYPSSLTSMYMTGWGFPYEQWPQDLKDEYAYNPTAAKQLLAAAGYPNGFKTNCVADIAADMDLLQIVKSYFAAVGIDMEIRPMDSASFTAFVINGAKQDQLDYRVGAGFLGYNAEPIRSLTRFQTNNSVNYIKVSDPIFDAFYTKAMASTTVDEIKKLVRDANEYVSRQHFCVSLLQPNLSALYQPWLKGYDGRSQAISISGAAGPHFISFYQARFWIDQNLKKSMGH